MSFSFLTRWRPIVMAVALVAAGDASAATAALPWHASRQLVLVTTDGWTTNHGTLRTYNRGTHGWVAAGLSVPVTIGKTGAGWGLGLNAPQHGGPVKREGDNRSPAGVFRIGDTFGYAAHADTAMPYRALSATDYCVDVSGATHYNQIIDADVVGAAAVKGSTEPMRRDIHLHGDQGYRQGFVIESNPDAVPQAGSCIFGHLWHSPSSPTAGCTAMTPVTMHALLAWLKPKDQPVFVLLPKAEYERLRKQWQLPLIAAKDDAR